MAVKFIDLLNFLKYGEYLKLVQSRQELYGENEELKRIIANKDMLIDKYEDMLIDNEQEKKKDDIKTEDYESKLSEWKEKYHELKYDYEKKEGEYLKCKRDKNELIEWGTKLSDDYNELKCRYFKITAENSGD